MPLLHLWDLQLWPTKESVQTFGIEKILRVTLEVPIFLLQFAFGPVNQPLTLLFDFTMVGNSMRKEQSKKKENTETHKQDLTWPQNTTISSVKQRVFILCFVFNDIGISLLLFEDPQSKCLVLIVWLNAPMLFGKHSKMLGLIGVVIPNFDWRSI